MRMSAVDSPDALSRELARERIQSAHRINLLRFWGVSAFFALFLLLGGLLRLPAWTGNLRLFAAYWVVTLVLFLAARRSDRVARFGTLALALVDVPMVFLLQWQTFPTSPSVSGVAGFTVGVYVLLVILAALSLENGYIVFTAAIAALFEIELQYLADVSVGAMVSTVILLGLTAIACSYARFRLVALVERLDRDIAEQQKAETALRQAERMAALAELGRELSGTLDPTAVAQRTADGIARLLSAKAAVLYRGEAGQGTLVTVAASGAAMRAFPPGAVIVPGVGAAGLAFAKDRAITVADVLTDSGIEMPADLRDRIRATDCPAVCAVPLRARGAVVGALEIGDVRGRIFTADEVHLAQAFADRAVLSSENARLYAELEARLRQLETSQEQLLQAGKLAALGQLVSGVAHEINNPLTVISGHAQMLSRRLTDRDLKRQLEKILDGATRAAKIVQNLQTFGRPRPRDVAWIDLRDVITRALALREDGLRFQGIQLLREIPESVPAVRGDAAQLEQVILNLVLNAEQALVGRPEPKITVRLMANDGWVRVSVTDTGPGIAPEILPRIFEPFFTTKPVGQGTGLGLSICYSIAQSHLGRLVAESLPGSGATVVLDLPANLDTPAVAPTATRTAIPSLRQGHVLVVEDEEEVAGVLRDLLEDMSVDVHVVTDGETAWRLLTTEGLVFDAVALDLRMPGLSGRTLYERLEKQAPAVAATVIFATGDTVDSETQLFLRQSARPVLTKPFTQESLSVTLAPFLSGASSEGPNRSS